MAPGQRGSGLGFTYRNVAIGFGAAGSIAIAALVASGISAGPNGNADAAVAYTLNGTCPVGKTCTWTKQSGSGACSFVLATNPDTNVTCDTGGDSKVLRLTANGTGRFDEMTLTVATGGTPLRIWPARTVEEVNAAGEIQGCDVNPVEPTAPTAAGINTVSTGLAADLASCMNTNPGEICRVTASITDANAFPNTVQDVEVRIAAGVRVRRINCNTCDDILIRGEGAGAALGSFYCLNCSDVEVRGLEMNGANDAESDVMPISIDNSDRVAFVADLITPNESGTFEYQCGIIATASGMSTDVWFAGVNCEAADNDGTSDWGIRMAGGRLVILDSMFESHSQVQPAVRRYGHYAAGDGTIIIGSTLINVDACGHTFSYDFGGGIDPQQSDCDAIADSTIYTANAQSIAGFPFRFGGDNFTATQYSHRWSAQNITWHTMTDSGGCAYVTDALLASLETAEEVDPDSLEYRLGSPTYTHDLSGTHDQMAPAWRTMNNPIDGYNLASNDPASIDP